MAAKELAAHHEGFKGKLASFWADMRVLASHPIYVLTVGGTAIYVGAASSLTQRHVLEACSQCHYAWRRRLQAAATMPRHHVR